MIDAFKAIFLKSHILTDTTRIAAQDLIAQQVGYRVYEARRPQDENIEKGDFIVLLEQETEHEYLLSGELDSTRPLIRVDCYSLCRKDVMSLWEAVRQALSSLSDTIDIPSGTVFLGGCTIESSEELDPEEPEDASDEFWHIYRGLFRVTHDQVSPAGIA